LFDEHDIGNSRARRVGRRKGSKSSKQDRRYFKGTKKNSRIEDPTLIYNQMSIGAANDPRRQTIGTFNVVPKLMDSFYEGGRKDSITGRDDSLKCKFDLCI